MLPAVGGVLGPLYKLQRGQYKPVKVSLKFLYSHSPENLTGSSYVQ
jgi:hypothetical protein